MKIKLTLRGRSREDIDLLVTTDATATVGDVAAVLAAAGPEGALPLIPSRSPCVFSIRLEAESSLSYRHQHS